MSIEWLIVLVISLIVINGCNIQTLSQKERHSFVLDKNKFHIDTLYLKMDSLVLNKNMHVILDSFIKKADDLGFNNSVLRANYGISIFDEQMLNFDGKWGNIKLFCTDDIEFLNQQFFSDINEQIPVVGGFKYNCKYFIVYHTSEINIFNELFSISNQKIDIPYFKIKFLKNNTWVGIFSQQLTVYYKYSDNAFKLKNMLHDKY